jgi:hypothetical protein
MSTTPVAPPNPREESDKLLHKFEIENIPDQYREYCEPDPGHLQLLRAVGRCLEAPPTIPWLGWATATGSAVPLALVIE